MNQQTFRNLRTGDRVSIDKTNYRVTRVRDEDPTGWGGHRKVWLAATHKGWTITVANDGQDEDFVTKLAAKEW